jgi:tRNA threonylcarbamoyladenosine biosynthesis protein TsaE
MEKYITNNSTQTKKLGSDLAKEFYKLAEKRARVLVLEGELGGGKTTFLQGLAKGLGIKEKILSPTFVILKKFKIPNPDPKTRHPRPEFFYHIDCYRIKKEKEILDLGFKKIVSDSKNIVAIEWADNIREILPKDVILIIFKFKDKNKRAITIRWQKKRD